MADVQLLFPTPIYHDQLDISDDERSRIQSYVEHLDWIVDKDIHNRPNGQYLDVFDVLAHNPLSNLATIIDNHMHAFVHDFLRVSRKLTVKRTNSWANRHYLNDYCHEHHHSNSVFSGVYYLNIPPNSGPGIVFKRMGPTWTSDAWEFNLDEVTAQNELVHLKRVNTNMLLLFPSHLTHMVPASETDEPRYSIAFNYFVYGEIGNGTNLVHVSDRR